MSKKYKQMQGDQSSAPAATAASSMSSSSAWSGGFQGGRLAALAATASDEAAEAEARPASRAVDNYGNGNVGEETPSLPQQVLMSLFDHPLFRRGIQDDVGKDEGSDTGLAGDQQQAKSRSQPSLSQAFLCGGIGGGGEIENESASAFPLSSLQQPPLPPRSGDDDNDNGSALEGELSSFPPTSKILGLTRAFSTPESRNRYRPLLDGDDGRLRRCGHRGNDLDKHLDLRQAATSEDGFNLKRDYPLLLQQSASSAFGSPAALGRFKGCAPRSGSNSGNSDPGASAFHPVWSSKSLSLSTSSVGSDHSRSEVGISTRSAPEGGRRRRQSPWRRVMARMKKGSRRSSLSGWENPARPNLNEDEATSPVNEPESQELLVAKIKPTIVATGDEICRDLLKLSFGGNRDTTAAATPLPGSVSSSSNTKMASNKAKMKKGRRKSSSSKCNKESKKSEIVKESTKISKLEKKAALSQSSLESYEDPGVALDLSESDDDTFEPIMGKFAAWDEDNHNTQSSRPSNADLTPQPTENGPSDQTHQYPRSPSIDVPCDSVEVIHRPSSCANGVATHVMEETAFGSSTSIQVFSSPAMSIEENSPPKVERLTVEESSEDRDNFPYPMGGGGVHEDAAATNTRETVDLVPARLDFRFPQRNAQPPATTRSPSYASSHDSPGSRLSSTGGSPASRMSSSNSRTTNTTILSGDRTVNTLQTEGSLVVDGADVEVRETNRRSSSLRVPRIGSVNSESNQEVTTGLDGNDTVFTSSTTSSNYHAYLSSPRPLRDGATMPVDRFFAGGNVTMSPSPKQRGTVDPSYPPLGSNTTTLAPTISKFIALSPKKSTMSRIGAASGMNLRDATHSPHTVSSNSVSANSTSSTETKKPLKFVAYEVREEHDTGSPYDEPPPSSMIKPRISNAVRHHTISQQDAQRRPPMVQRTSMTGHDPRKPPQSPRKQDYGRHVSGARTPTRTPPPSHAYKDAVGSGANTPCSPPVIVDGPNVLVGDSSTKPKRPYVVRRGGGGARGIFLIPPSSASSYRPSHPPPIPPQPLIPAAASLTEMRYPLRDNNCPAVVGGGTVDGAQGIVFDTADPTVMDGGVGSAAATMSVESHAATRSSVYNVASRNMADLKDNHANGDVVAIVSP